MTLSLEKREMSYSPTIMQILHLVGGHNKKMRRYISVILSSTSSTIIQVLPIKEGTKTPPHLTNQKGRAQDYTKDWFSTFETQYEGLVRSVQD